MLNKSLKVLLVEDDQDHSEIVNQILVEAGHNVTISQDGRLGLKEFFSFSPDLVLLDVQMPVMDGWKLLERIREVSRVPVIMLTVLGRENDKINGLRIGADDYLVKPVGGLELLARIDTAVRRTTSGPEMHDFYQDSVLSIDFPRHEVHVRSQEVHLSPIEFRLLVTLVQNLDTVMSSSELLDRCWRNRESGAESVRVYINYLRKKLEEDPANPQLLKTVRGYGYKYRPQDA